MNTLAVGSRVMKKGWARSPEHQYLARLGRVLHVAGPNLVEIRWDAGEFGAPAKDRLEHIDELLHLWWRSS